MRSAVLRLPALIALFCVGGAAGCDRDNEERHLTQMASEIDHLQVARDDANRQMLETDVADTHVTGGEPREMLVTLSPARLAASGVTPGEVLQALRGANARLQAGEYAAANAVVRVDVGAPLSTAAVGTNARVSAEFCRIVVPW